MQNLFLFTSLTTTNNNFALSYFISSFSDINVLLKHVFIYVFNIKFSSFFNSLTIDNTDSPFKDLGKYRMW